MNIQTDFLLLLGLLMVMVTVAANQDITTDTLAVGLLTSEERCAAALERCRCRDCRGLDQPGQQWLKALDYHQQHLAIAHNAQDSEMLEATLGNAGSCHHAMGRYDQHYHNQHLTLAQQIGNREGESNTLED